MPPPNESWLQALQAFFLSRSARRRIAKILAHPVSLLAVATLLGALAGAWLTGVYQERMWLRQTQFEMFRQGYAEAQALLRELSEAMSRRLFGMQRVVWVAKGTGTGELEPVWQAYYESVEDWNARLLDRRIRLVQLVGPEEAQTFAASADSLPEDPQSEPPSLHEQFRQAHEQVRALVDCVRHRCPDAEREAALKRAQEQLNGLGLEIEAFIGSCWSRIESYAAG